mmetsp:Transcript_86641/g.245688  ORF Transcript_86641/g.245688 Transcript_86641/m.245688 type:complete len:292 (+) Transcript_86641:93-968(+)
MWSGLLPIRSALGSLHTGTRGGVRAPRARVAARLVLFLGLALPALAAEAKKKSKFLAAYPSFFKLFLFWWCIFVFAVMSVYILDNLLYRLRGPQRMYWAIDHTFSSSASREVYWSQFVDPTSWSQTHPILQTADVCVVNCDAPVERAGSTTEQADERPENASTQFTKAPLSRLKPGLGIAMLHKTVENKGALFCTRKCVKCDTAKEGAWHFVMRTVEVGAGYPFLADSEETELEMWPAEDGVNVRCQMRGFASVASRAFGWWKGLKKASRAGAAIMLEAIEDEVKSIKKQE